MEGEQTSRDLGRSPARGEKHEKSKDLITLPTVYTLKEENKMFIGKQKEKIWKKNIKKKTLVTCSKSDYKKISYDYKKIS